MELNLNWSLLAPEYILAGWAGMVVKIDRPDRSTRLQLIRTLAKARGLKVTEAAAELARLATLGSGLDEYYPRACRRKPRRIDLVVCDNQLTSLPPGIVQLTGLQVLHFHMNRLTSLRPEIGQLINLLILYLDGNKLTSLPAEIGQLSSLHTLDLGEGGRTNPLTTLPPELGRLKALIGHAGNSRRRTLLWRRLTGPHGL